MTRKTILHLHLALFLFAVTVPKAASAADLLEVLSPANFQKLYGFPVTVEVELAKEARASTFQAILNGKDVTSAFRDYGYGMKAVFYLEDGLRYSKGAKEENLPNILETKVGSIKPGKETDFRTYFFLQLGDMSIVGPEGGNVKSRDGRMRLDIPANALSSTTEVALTKRPDSIDNQPVYQISSRRIHLKRPMSVVLAYEPADLPQDVGKEDLLMIWDGDVLTHLPTREVKAEKAVMEGSGRLLTAARIFLSYYVSIESKLSDIPTASGVTLPVGDDGDAPYDCGNNLELKRDRATFSPNQLVWASSNTDKPKITLNIADSECKWRTRTIFAQRDMEGVLFPGEEWEFACRQNAPSVLPVRAIADGLVVYNQGEPGDAIVLAHRMNGIPFLSIYANRVERSPCPVGDFVKRGDVIAKIGKIEIDPVHLDLAIGQESLIHVEDETGKLKVPAVWFRHWSEKAVRDKYYDPTDFLLNLADKYKWDFESDGNDEGWTVENVKSYHNGSGYRIQNGMLAFKPGSGKVQLTSYPLNIDAADFDSLFIKMKTTPPVEHVTVYFSTPEAPDFAQAQAMDFDILQDGFREYRVFMADNERWAGTISGIRVEFVDAAADDDSEIIIDRIRFGRGFLSKVPDTGQTSCYDLNRSIPCPSPGEPFFGQDANYLIHPPDYQLESIGGTDMVTDQVTGLAWRKQADGVGRTWLEAVDYVATLEAGWRLPTKKELQTLLDYGDSPSAACIDTSFFPMAADAPLTLWSATTEGFLSKDAWTVCFGNCQVNNVSKDDLNGLLPVRGRVLEFARFKDNGDNTVTDLSTGLMWYQRETSAMNWKGALVFCERLETAGHTDWRLPSIKELQTIVDDERRNPTLDILYFPGCRPFIYWSSTTNAQHPEFAWYTRFDDGRVYGSGLKTHEYYVRAVRTVY